MLKFVAKTISLIFHPFLMPTLAFLLLFNSGFYFSMFSWEVKRFVLIVVFFTTSLLPVLTIALMALNPKYGVDLENKVTRILPLLFSAIYYFVGYYLLNKLPVYSVFKVFLLASILVIITLLLISFIWKISSHMAGIGGLFGTVLALAFRMGVNPLLIIVGIILITGLVGTSRMLLEKHNLPQVLGGFALGFSVLYLVIYFV